MRRVLLPILMCLALAGCGSLVPQTGPDCRSAFAKTLPECQGQGGGSASTTQPELTAVPTLIPATPTPAPVKPAEYEALMTRLGAYGVQMDGFNPANATPYNQTDNPFKAGADVVNLTIERFAQIEGLQLLVVVLKMDDSTYEATANYQCQKAEATELDKNSTDGKVHDLFYPGSEDRYVYFCGKPTDYIRGYNGWALFLTLDPSQGGQIIIRTCDSVNNCTSSTAPAPTTAVP